MTQYQLVKEYILEYGSILPAKLSGSVYKGTMFGSEISKRCRELRKKGILTSVKEGKFERFFLIDQDTVEVPIVGTVNSATEEVVFKPDFLF